MRSRRYSTVLKQYISNFTRQCSNMTGIAKKETTAKYKTAVQYPVGVHGVGY